MISWLPLLLSTGAFGAPLDADEALDRLDKADKAGQRLLLLEELPELINRSDHPEKRVTRLKDVVTTDWSAVVVADWRDVCHRLEGKRLPGRPVSLDLVRSFPCGVETALLLPDHDLAQLGHPLDRRLHWSGCEALLVHAIENTLPSDTHELMALLELKKPGLIEIEVEAAGAWQLQLAGARWNQSRLGPSLPDRVRLSLDLHAGKHPLRLRVEGGDEIRFRLVGGQGRWLDPSQTPSQVTAHRFDPVPIPVLEHLRDWPAGRARWLVARGMGDLLSERSDNWEECRRLLADRTMTPEGLQRALEPRLSQILAANPLHIGALVESANLSLARAQPVAAHRLLARARTVTKKDPEVFAASVRLAVHDGRVVAARHWLRKLQTIAPRWQVTERLTVIVDGLTAPADRGLYPINDLRSVRTLARSAPTADRRRQALESLRQRVPWELGACIELAKCGLQQNKTLVNVDWPASRNARQAWARLVTTADGTDPFMRWRPGPELYQPEARFPDQASSLLFDMMGLEFHADGSQTEIIHQLIRIHGDRGIDEWTTFTPWGELLELKVITPDGDSWIPLVIPGENEITLPRLMPGALIDMRTRRHWSPLEAPLHISSHFYFRDPQRRSTLAHSLLVLRHPKDQVPKVLEHGLTDLGRNSERYTYHEEEDSSRRIRLWETRNMKSIPATRHHLPDEVELPWVRIHPAQPKALTAVRWIEGTHPYLEVSRTLKSLVTKITVGCIGDDEKLQALIDWHRQQIEPGSELMGHRALQQRRGQMDTSLVTLLRAAGFEAHLFHARPDHRFHDPTDAVDRAEGVWPLRGVVLVNPAGRRVLVPHKPWLGLNEVPESWAGRRARYWANGQWQAFTLPAVPVLSIDKRSVTLDLTNNTFAFRQERHGDSLEDWQPWLWASTHESQGHHADLGLFAGLQPVSADWHRPKPGRLALAASGTCANALEDGWTLPPLRALMSWMPDGPLGAGLWIAEDRVTIDEVTVILPEGMQLTGLPKPGRWAEPGVALEWEIETTASQVTVRRTWRVQAGIVRGATRRRFLEVLKRADLMDRRRWKVVTKP